MKENNEKLSIPFEGHFYSINNTLLKKIENCLNSISEKFSKIMTTGLSDCYSKFSYREKKSTYFYEIGEEVENIINIIPSKDTFYNYCMKLACKVQQDFLDYVILQSIDMVKLLELEKQIGSLFNPVNLIHNFIKEQIGNFDHSNPDFDYFEDYDNLQKISNSLVEENIFYKKIAKYELIVDGQKFYIQEDGKIIACNDNPLQELQDDFSKDFTKNKNGIIDKIFQHKVSQLYPVGSPELEEIKNEQHRIIELFKERERYQKIFRFNYVGKTYKNDYYYFDIDEFLNFYPKEFSNKVKEYYKKDIYSFMFNSQEVESILLESLNINTINYNNFENILKQFYKIVYNHVTLDSSSLKDFCCKLNFDYITFKISFFVFYKKYYLRECSQNIYNFLVQKKLKKESKNTTNQKSIINKYDPIILLEKGKIENIKIRDIINKIPFVGKIKKNNEKNKPPLEMEEIYKVKSQLYQLKDYLTVLNINVKYSDNE